MTELSISTTSRGSSAAPSTFPKNGPSIALDSRASGINSYGPNDRNGSKADVAQPDELEDPAAVPCLTTYRNFELSFDR